MSATVLELPRGRPSRYARVPLPARTSAQVVQFCRSARLTTHDLYAINAVMSSVGGWRCETEHENLSAIMLTGSLAGDDHAVLMICRSDRKLLLMQAQATADWRMLGMFDDVADLVLAVGRIIDEQRER